VKLCRTAPEIERVIFFLFSFFQTGINFERTRKFSNEKTFHPLRSYWNQKNGEISFPENLSFFFFFFAKTEETECGIPYNPAKP
jgi:hypothetical protein